MSILLLSIANLLILTAAEAPECPENAGAAVLLQKGQLRERAGLASELLHTDADDVDVGAYGLSTIPDLLLNKMVMGNPYKCQFLLGASDMRARTCEKTMLEAGLHPAHLTAEGNHTYERANALRALLPIGSLPCCTTAPYCAAPNCAASFLEGGGAKTCTKRPAASNYAYMVHPEVWPAYHGLGGSFELDVQKHWDILAQLISVQPGLPPFDLAIDLGANSGLVTERFVMRRFAKDYIMVEAAPNLKHDPFFESRFGKAEWRDSFVLEQSTKRAGDVALEPKFEFMNFALSDVSGGVLDTCGYQQDLGNTSYINCTAEMATADSLIPGRLSPDFATKFSQAQSAYVKIDTEGMDEKVLQGMGNLLAEKRGDGFLVNFLMLEFCTSCVERVRKFNNLDLYDLKTVAHTLESLGFEAFLMGPRYLPLTHGSWDDAFVEFSKSPENQRCNVARYPKFLEMYPEVVSNGKCMDQQSVFTGDIFALRSSHPKAAEIKVALGACVESHDFNISDPQYDWQGDPQYDPQHQLSK